jgi:hypothetical protein
VVVKADLEERAPPSNRGGIEKIGRRGRGDEPG